MSAHLRQLAESWRAKAGSVETKNPPVMYVQVVNVVRAFELCAEELEEALQTMEASAQSAQSIESVNPT